MVNIKLNHLYFVFFIILFSDACFAKENLNSPQLFLFTDKSESVLGRPIRAELYGVSLNTKIINIKLSPLNDDYGVVIDYAVNDTRDQRWPNKSIQILKLKLYPRQTGNLIIPSLSINSVQTQKKNIHISEGITGVPEIRFSTSSPYERQQIIAHITVTSPDPTSRLSIKDKTEIKGFESTPLAFKRTKNKSGSYLLQIGWALSAIQSGTFKLELPPIDYSVSGVSRKQYYLPHKMVNIKPLPSYLPPTIPVGKLTIKSQAAATNILQTNSLSYWNIMINGTLNSAYKLPPVLRQIKSNKHVTFLPPNSNRFTNTTDSTLLSTVNHSIPFKSLKSGFVKLPEIKIQYFDPEDGKLKKIIHHSTSVFVLSIIWRSIFGIAIILILFYVARKSYEKWLKHKYSQCKRTQAIQILEDNGINGIRESINLLAEAEYWPKNTTLSQWAKLWGNKYQVSNDFQDLILMLSAYFYSSNSNYKSSELKLQLLNLVRNRTKI